MAPGTRFPAWQAAAVRSLLAIPGVEVALLISPDRAPAGGGWRGDGEPSAEPSRRRARMLELLGDRRHLLWNVFNKGYVERRSRASRGVDLSDVLELVPQLRCRTVPAGRFGEVFSADDIESIAGHDLDFVLRFGFGIIKGAILDVPRHGVWSFHHGDEREYRGRPPGFWELVDGRRVVGAILQRLTDRLDGGVVLHRGTFRAIPHSYLRTRDEAFLGSSDWPAVVCRAVMLGDTAAAARASTTDAPVRRNPGNGVMLRFLVRQAAAFAVAQWRGLTSAAKWTVGVADVPVSAFLDGGTPEIRWLPEHGRSRYLADPFALPGLAAGGTAGVALVEDYDYRSHRGVIAAVALDGTGRPRTVIDPGVHASYPYLFKAEGTIWCLPETYQAGELRLYRAVSFPDVWEHVATPLTDVAAVDATMLRHDGRWWILCTDHRDGPDTKLRIWHGDDLLGSWHPHPLNPVKTDIRSSRPAGTPFLVDGVLYRPAQDGTASYGGAITINRIDVLSPTAFSEQPVAGVSPPAGRYRHGVHTLCAAGDRTIIDGRRDTFIAAAFTRELQGRLRKLRQR